MMSTKGLPVRSLCVRAASSNALADLQRVEGLAAQALDPHHPEKLVSSLPSHG